MLLTAPVVLFAGKGGVGKTTLAAAHAQGSAAAGARTLLVSTDPAHSTADLLGRSIGAEPVAIADRLWAVELDPDVEGARYVGAARARIAGIAPPGMAPEVERQLELALATPGVVEAAVLERLAALVAGVGADWDRVVVDTAPFGHTLRLLAMPDALGQWLDAVIGRRRGLGALERMWRTVRGAPPETDGVLAVLEARRERIRALRTTLGDPARSAVVLVAIPERLSLLETERSAATLRKAGMTPAGLYVNRVRPGRDAVVAEFRRAFPSLRIQVIDEAPADVRDRDVARYIGARLEASA